MSHSVVTCCHFQLVMNFSYYYGIAITRKRFNNQTNSGKCSHIASLLSNKKNKKNKKKSTQKICLTQKLLIFNQKKLFFLHGRRKHFLAILAYHFTLVQKKQISHFPNQHYNYRKKQFPKQNFLHLLKN